MGADDGEDAERPAHAARVPSFWIARHPVTNAEYACFLAANPGVREPPLWGDVRFGGEDLPVVGLTPDEVAAYCRWAGVELPTEAQWEWAARAGTVTRYWSGDGERDGLSVGWCAANSGGRLHPVAEKAANPWGLCDVHGNVWELCATSFRPYSLASETDSPDLAAPAQLVVRGGAFCDPVRLLRAAAREGVAVDAPPRVDVGFRVVLAADPP